MDRIDEVYDMYLENLHSPEDVFNTMVAHELLDIVNTYEDDEQMICLKGFKMWAEAYAKEHGFKQYVGGF